MKLDRLTRAIAETAIPPGQAIPGGSSRTVARLEATLAELDPRLGSGWRALAHVVDAAALASTGHRFASLPLGGRLRVLERLDAHEPGRLALRGLLTPLKLAHFDDPLIHERLGCRYELETPSTDEPARWRSAVSAASELDEAEIECDVVVVGTGAGGAPIAAKLSEAGHAVLLLEEGGHHTRTGFDGRPVDALRRLYRRGGATIAFGNTAIPIPVGRAVGGTTLINSGTCFRVPEPTLRKWRAESGIEDLTPEALDPFYAEVERFLEIAPSTEEALGAPARLIARGCDALGWQHHPLARNAPGCDGQGLCCFGCPTDAKRSTNVSWVPRALSAGAMLLTGARVEGIQVEGGRATGVKVRTTDTGRAFSVRARAVVLSAGSLSTPVLLLRQGLANASGMVGRNLSIHPATAAVGLFEEEVDGFRAVPQGYGVDEFHDEGILFEGASLPLEIAAAMTPGFGPSWTQLMEAAGRSLVFGFMVQDHSRGRVRAGPDGEPRISYWLGRGDLRQVRRGMGLLARLFFAAGAREVHPPVVGHGRLRSLADVERMEAAHYPARHVDLTAYHPIGTCCMGVDPRRSVVDGRNAAHDLPGLTICDGSSLPGAPGVNPQETIMAMSLRAADFVAEGLG